MALAPAPLADWYVATTTLSKPAARCRGARATARIAAEQFGLAISFGCCRKTSPFTSGTTRGTSGSMRKAEELSITTAPACKAAGANSRDRVAPALKKA